MSRTPSTFVNHRALLRALIYRSILGRYRRSLLGPAWAILQPLIYMVVFTAIRGITEFSSEGYPYFLFTFSALVPWTFMSNAVTRSSQSVYKNRNIVKKLSAAREIFPFSEVCVALVDFAIAAVILTGMMAYYHVDVGVNLLWLPLLVMLIVILSFGIGMALAAPATFKRDITIAAPFLVQFWLFVSPVMYGLKAQQEQWGFISKLNPAAGIIEGFRAVLMRNESPPLDALLLSALMSLLVLCVGWGVYRTTSRYFADIL